MIDEKHLVTVIMSAYDEKLEWVEAAVESILNQTYKKIEFIILLDNPENIELKNYFRNIEKNDSRIKFIENEKNLGLPITLNKGIDASKGYYIARMDADDIAKLNRIEKQVKYLDMNPDIHLIGTSIGIIDESGNIIKNEKIMPKEYNNISKLMKYCNCFAHPTLLFRKSSLDIVGKYRMFRYSQDYDFTYRFITNELKSENLDEPLLLYRERNNSISGKNPLTQFKLALYIQKLAKQRKKLGEDNFSEDTVKEILDGNKRDDYKYNRALLYHQKSKYNRAQKNKLKAIYYIILSCINSKYFTTSIYNTFMYRLILKINS